MSMRTMLFRAVSTGVLSMALATSAFAQAGLVKGRVVDAQGQPVEGAKVELETEGKKAQTTTDKKGEFVQIGLKSGAYKVTATKDKLAGSAMANVRQGGSSNIEVRVAAAAAGGVDNKKFQALQAAFSAGNAAAQSGDHDGAIAKFEEALTIMPECKDCFTNIGYEYNAKRDYMKAEEAFKKALAMDPSLGDAATGLGVAYVNTGKFKEAKEQFDVAVKADPRNGFAQYQLGMASINLNQMADAVKALEAYLEVDPTGEKAAEVKATLPALKAMVK